jgi:hypothetical protein
VNKIEFMDGVEEEEVTELEPSVQISEVQIIEDIPEKAESRDKEQEATEEEEEKEEEKEDKLPGGCGRKRPQINK